MNYFYLVCYSFYTFFCSCLLNRGFFLSRRPLRAQFGGSDFSSAIRRTCGKEKVKHFLQLVIFSPAFLLALSVPTI